MKREESSKSWTSLDRRGFFRYVGVGSAALSLASGVAENLAGAEGTEAEKELITYYPGARFLTGPWRLRIDEQEVGKQQEWYRREPSDSLVKAVSLAVPSCWQEYVPGLAGGVGWYFKDFSLPNDLRGRILRMKFWAVDYFAEVWMNGESVGSHEGGFTPFELDITQQARPGEENRLVIRVVDPPRPYAGEDRPQYVKLVGLPGWEGMTDGVVDGFRFMEIPHGLQSWQEGLNFGGIWQPVELLETDPVYISDVFIEAKLTGSAIEAHVELTNKSADAVPGKVGVIVKPWKESEQMGGRGEKPVRISPGGPTAVDVHVDVREPHPWSPDDPYLYVAEVRIEDAKGVRHSTTARFGFREFTVRDGYFHLNGKRIFIKSGHHQGTYPTTLVYPPTRDFAYKEVRMFKEAGFNFCRLWVKPAPLPFLDAADELGLMLQEEPPLSLMEDSPWMLPRSLREVRALVNRDRNRPSIVVWNMINEHDPPIKYVREQCQAAREVDPTRLITESAGGPSRYYLPYSQEGISYLTEHPYPGAPISEGVYDYQNTRGVPGQLCFFSEYGYGGMNDIDSVLANYGYSPKTYMEDYAGHALLKVKREKMFSKSGILKQIFGDIASLREACQTVQADTVRLHSEAMRANPVAGGYNYVQVFDSQEIELDGLADFWRDKRKKSFYAMQEVNKPLLLVVRCSPMNGRSGEGVKVKVTLVNEEKIEGRKRLTVRVKSPSGSEVFSQQQTVEAKPWVSVVFEVTVKISGESGRYPVEAVLWDGSTALVRKEDFCTIYAEEDLRWPSRPALILDASQKLESFLKERGIGFEQLRLAAERPAVIVVTPFEDLEQRPDEFPKFVNLFSQVERGCRAIFLGVPKNGPAFSGATVSPISFLSPAAISAIFPFSVSELPDTREILRIGAYAWGLTEPMTGVPIPAHAVFNGIPKSGIMGREYGNVAPVASILTPRNASDDTGPAVEIFNYGKGKIILTCLNLLPHLRRDALAEKLLCNLVRYADQGLPSELSPEPPATAEILHFWREGYQDCWKKYLAKRLES